MADNKTASDVQQALEQQISDLRGELKRLSKSLASRSSDLRDSAEDAFDDASGRFATRHRLFVSVVRLSRKQSRKTLVRQRRFSAPPVCSEY